MAAEHLIVGSYTGADGRDGITVWSLAGDQPEKVQAVALLSPTYLVAHPERPLVFAVTEAPASAVSALRRVDGQLELLSTMPTDAAGACHLALDPTGQFVLVAHYDAGCVTSHHINDDGSVTSAIDTAFFTGSGPVENRQDAAHAHQVVVDRDVLLVPDLGADVLRRLKLAPNGELESLEPVQLPAGLGPRHLVIFDEEDVAAVACELTGDMWLAQRNGDTWSELGLFRGTRQDEHTLPSGLVRRGSHLIMANRDADTFAEFALRDTELVFVDERPTAGKGPRDLVVRRPRAEHGPSTDELWVANERSGSVVQFTPFAGSWKQGLELPAPAPACLLFVDASAPVPTTE